MSNAMVSRFIDWIWHVRGSVPLAPGQSSEDAFDRLGPLFRQSGTSLRRTGDTLTFHKKDPASQDKMSVFDGGVLTIENATLRYHLTSRALLFCFLAPLLFLGFAQLTVALGKYEASTSHAAAEKKPDKKDAVPPMNPIDKFLGAPAPDKPDKKAADKKEDKKHSPTAAYVFAAIFAVLYVVGRVLESRLIKSLFAKKLLSAKAG